MIAIKDLLRKIHKVTVPKIAAEIYNEVAFAAMGGFYSVVADDIARKVKMGKLLDIGTGPGYLPINLARRTKKVQTVGIDVDKKAIAHARANAAEFEIPLSRAQFGIGDAQNVPFKNSEFNFVVSTSVLRHVHRPVKMLNEVYRVLKKGGEAWIYDFCRNATDMEINEQIMDVDDRLKRGKMNPTQRSWVTLIMRRQISVESYSVAEITEIVSKSKFRSCVVQRDGVRVKVILKK